MKRSGLLRFSLAVTLIALTAILLQARGRNEIMPYRLPLPSFPAQLGSWDSTEIELDKQTLDILGAGDFMERVYQNQAQRLPAIDLFLAYFPSQRAGDTIHSPQHCLPGAGWNPEENNRVALSLPGQLVVYWYWAHDRGVASEYWAKYYLVADSIRMNRSDGALVRITTDMFPGETADAAQQRILPFASAVSPLLDDYIPR
jgi:EpsI family protein